jgi:anti-anti-sigma factor
MTTLITNTTINGAGGLLVIDGEIDCANAHDLATAGVAALEDPAVASLTIDLGAMTFCDAAGLGALIRIRNAAGRQDKVLRLGRRSGPFERLLRLSQLEAAFLPASGASTMESVPMTPRVVVARVYAPPAGDGGIRVLVDRLWPRGLTKSAAALDLWCHAIAPSTELRTWFGHEPDRLEEFISRYESELSDPDRAAALVELKELAREHTVTLLTATKDIELSHAPVLARLIELARNEPSS